MNDVTVGLKTAGEGGDRSSKVQPDTQKTNRTDDHCEV